MTWVMKLGEGTVVESDDFTLGDLGDIEKEADAIWSVANPFRSSRVAKAFLRVAYRRAGLDPQDVDALTLRQLKSMFDFRPDEGEEGEPDRPTRSRRKQTSRGSSTGAPTDSTGPRPLLEDSA